MAGLWLFEGCLLLVDKRLACISYPTDVTYQTHVDNVTDASKGWQELFSKGNMHFLDYELLKLAPQTALGEVLEFLRLGRSHRNRINQQPAPFKVWHHATCLGDFVESNAHEWITPLPLSISLIRHLTFAKPPRTRLSASHVPINNGVTPTIYSRPWKLHVFVNPASAFEVFRPACHAAHGTT